MPWTVDDPPNVAKNWTPEEIAKCVAAANAALEKTGDDEQAIFACIAAAGREQTMTERIVYTRAYREEPEPQAEPSAEAGPIRFIASTEAMGRDGMTIKADAWQLENYRANPVVLWAHDYTMPPIGRADVTQEEGKLIASVTFDQGDDLAKSIERKYRDGFLHSVSVGWNTQENEGATVTKAELLDVSAVPVPGDPGALIQRMGVTQPGLRVGAVLNARNRDALEQAVELIKSVLKSAQKPAESDDKEEPERSAPITEDWPALSYILNRLNEVK